MDEMFKSVEEFEKKLSLPKGFYNNLLHEDDWSFIIKISALFEAACTHTLAKRLAAPEIEEALSYLDQANSKFGKIILLKKLNAIYPEQAKILIKLAELRNSYVHNIANVGTTLSTVISQWDSNQKKAFVDWSGYGLKEEIEIKDKKVTRADFVLSNPKISIWLVAAEVLACLQLEVANAELIEDFNVRKIIKNITS